MKLYSALAIGAVVLVMSCGSDRTTSDTSAPAVKSNQTYQLLAFPGLAAVPGAASVGAFMDVMEAVAEDIQTNQNRATSHLLVTGELLQIAVGDTILVTEVQSSRGYVRGWMRSGTLAGQQVYLPVKCLVLQPDQL